MADISGSWVFTRSCLDYALFIGSVSSSGALIDSNINGTPIKGHYDVTTNAISFNDQRFHAEILNVTYYTGYVMLRSDGTPCAMAGTYHELALSGNWPELTLNTVQSAFYALSGQGGPVIQ